MTIVKLMLDVFITSRVRRKIIVVYAKYPDFKTHVRGLAKLIKEDAGNIGFRDDIIYKYLEGKNKDLINLKQMDRDECIEAFNEYSKNNGTIY